jgi:3-dehydroquinate synthase
MNKATKISIAFPRYTQEVFVGYNLTDIIIEKIKKGNYDKVILLVDETVKRKFNVKINKLIKHVFTRVVIPSFYLKGKKFFLIGRILHLLKTTSASRKSCICVIGGGSLGDLAGFAASIYMRGVDMIYIPTTFMSQADTIIGKVGVNLGNHKNLVGSFYSPRYTFCDLDYIRTLDHYQILSGLVEVWKHSILKNDLKLEKQVIDCLIVDKKTELINIISRSILIKKTFAEKDTYDSLGIHKLLSFGHTFANYAETNKKILHGEGVLYGILFETFLSYELGNINEEKKNKILKTFILFHKYLNRDREIIRMLNSRKFVKQVYFDKINSHHKLNFVIPNDVGCVLQKNTKPAILEEVVNKYIAYLTSLTLLN